MIQEQLVPLRLRDNGRLGYTVDGGGVTVFVSQLMEHITKFGKRWFDCSVQINVVSERNSIGTVGSTGLTGLPFTVANIMALIGRWRYNALLG